MMSFDQAHGGIGMSEGITKIAQLHGAEIYRDGSPDPDGKCVLLWVQRAKRATSNKAANFAVDVANALDLPIIAVFSLVETYPGATLRAYHYLAESLSELPASFAKRGIGWQLRIGPPGSAIPTAAAELGAAIIVTDQDTIPLGRTWREDVARAISVPLFAVDTDTVVPTSYFPNPEHASHTIRPKLWKRIAAADLLDAIPDPRPKRRWAGTIDPGPNPKTAIEAFPIDRSVGPSPTIRGTRTEGEERLRSFVDLHLPTYAEQRNFPDRRCQSMMSSYLHFGVFGPVEIARACIDARTPNGGFIAPRGHAVIMPEPAIEDASLQVFLDELITQRELAINYALRWPNFDRWESVPEWGRASMTAHASDPKPFRYRDDQLERGETHDQLWNAAQRQMVFEGYMPNYLRMYWAKQLPYWMESPEAAFNLAVHMNDRFQLDGRDANGYSGIAWSLGGRHDRPFPPNKPILGLIRPMGLRGMRKKFDVDAYIKMIADMIGEPIPGSAEPGPPTPRVAQPRLEL